MKKFLTRRENIPNSYQNKIRYIPKRVQAIIMKRFEEKKLFEQRKQLFNVYSTKKFGGGLDQRAKELFYKNLGSLSPEVQRLIFTYTENIRKNLKEANGN